MIILRKIHGEEEAAKEFHGGSGSNQEGEDVVGDEDVNFLYVVNIT